MDRIRKSNVNVWNVLKSLRADMINSKIMETHPMRTNHYLKASTTMLCQLIKLSLASKTYQKLPIINIINHIPLEELLSSITSICYTSINFLAVVCLSTIDLRGILFGVREGLNRLPGIVDILLLSLDLGVSKLAVSIVKI